MESLTSLLGKPFDPHNVFPLRLRDLLPNQVPRLVRNPITGTIIHICHYITYIRVQEYQPASLALGPD